MMIECKQTNVNKIETEKNNLINKMATIRDVDPINSLKRGFCLTYTEKGEIVKSIAELNQNDSLKTEFFDGYVHSGITVVERKN